LLGAGAAVLAGGGVAAVELANHPYQRFRVEELLGLIHGPDYVPPPSGAKQVSGVLASRYMSRSLGWTVSVPGGGVRPRAVIFCLHAKDGNHRMAFDAIHLPDMAASVGLPVAVAGVDGGADSYWHKRADGTDAMSMLLDEFVPMVVGRVGKLPQAVMGWSMGGFGALLAAERASGEFKAVATGGAALWTTPGSTAPGAFDSAEDYHANDVFRGVGSLRGLGVALGWGESDPFYGAARRFVSLLDFPHTTLFAPGLHDVAFWRSIARRQLVAMAPALGLGH
jgi:hypothetical protein